MPVQIVVTSQLSNHHSSLRVLSTNVEKEDAVRFLQESMKVSTPGDRDNVDAVLQVSVNANYFLYQDVRRENVMCEALERLMADVIEERVEEKVNERINKAVQQAVEQAVEKAVEQAVEEAEQQSMQQGMQQGILDSLRKIMSALKMTALQAMDVLQIPESEREVYLSRL